MSFPYKNPTSLTSLSAPEGVSLTSTQGTNFSVSQVGGYMEVYYLRDLELILTAATYPSQIQLSANTIPINFTKGTGSAFSPDFIIIEKDNYATRIINSMES